MDTNSDDNIEALENESVSDKFDPLKQFLMATPFGENDPIIIKRSLQSSAFCKTPNHQIKKSIYPPNITIIKVSTKLHGIEHYTQHGKINLHLI